MGSKKNILENLLHSMLCQSGHGEGNKAKEVDSKKDLVYNSRHTLEIDLYSAGQPQITTMTENCFLNTLMAIDVVTMLLIVRSAYWLSVANLDI